MTYRIVPALLAIGVFGPLLYWSVDNTPPVIVHSAVPTKMNIARGDPLVVDYNLTYNRFCDGDAQRLFVDAADVLLPIEPYRFRAGSGNDDRRIALNTPENVSVSASIPAGMAIGPAKYQVLTEFYCNPLQRILGWGILYKFPAVQFNVTGEPVRTTAPKARQNLIQPSDNPLRNIMPPLPDAPLVLPK